MMAPYTLDIRFRTIGVGVTWWGNSFVLVYDIRIGDVLPRGSISRPIHNKVLWCNVHLWFRSLK